MRWPSRSKAAARFTESVDLPTPPLPLAIARTRVEASTEMPFERPLTSPRSLVVSAARSSGLITSKSSETDSTPGSGSRCSATWVSKLERSGQPATVSAIVTATCPFSTRTSRTMSSSVTGRFSSGSMTLPSASVICSRLGCSTQRA